MKLTRRRDLTMDFTPTGQIRFRSVGAGVEGIGPPEAALVLSFCSKPTSRDEILARFGPGGGQAFDALCQGELLVPEDQAENTELFFQGFTSIDMHRRMLADHPRVDGYANAIQALVQPGMVVADAGTGTGVLACIAAQAGAAQVYAVDRVGQSMAKTVIEASGFADRIATVKGDLRDTVLPQKVDLVVSETFGAMALSEGGSADVALFCEHNLKPGGVSIPSEVRMHIAPVIDLSGIEETPDVFGLRYGADLRPLRGEALRRGVVTPIPEASLGAASAIFAELPFPGPDAAGGSVRFDTLEGERLLGWACWFDLQMAPDQVLSTGPHAPLTHWRQQLLAIEPWPLKDGALSVEIGVRPAVGDRRGLEVVTRWNQGDHTGQSNHRVV